MIIDKKYMFPKIEEVNRTYFVVQQIDGDGEDIPAIGPGFGSSQQSGISLIPETGLFQGNGDIHNKFWNLPEEITWSLGKNDVWDRRYYGDSKPVVTLEDIRRLAFRDNFESIEGENIVRNSAYGLSRAYDFPCPKPVGQFIIRCGELKGAVEYQATLTFGDGRIMVTAAKEKRKVEISNYVMATDNLCVFTCDYRNLNGPVKIELYRHRDTLRRGRTVMEDSGSYPHFNYDYDQDTNNGPMEPPVVGTDGRFFWIKQKYFNEPDVPGDFECVVMGLIVGEEYQVITEENVLGAGAKAKLPTLTSEEFKTLHGAHKEKRKAMEMSNEAPGWLASATLEGKQDLHFTVYLSMVTSRDVPNPFVRAKEILIEAENKGEAFLLQGHLSWWESFWSKSAWIETSKHSLLVPLYHSLYNAASTLRKGKVPAFNATPHLYTDAHPWHGDYHFNEMFLLPLVMANHSDILEAWCELIEEMLPMAQLNAREVYGCSGAMYPLVHYPVRTRHVIRGSATWDQGMEMTGLALQIFYQIFSYTHDITFLQRSYPLIREGARFYADYFKKEADGFYHVPFTVSQEHWGITKNFERNRDSTGALSLARYQLNAAIDCSERLGIDEEERTKWKDITDNITPYSTYESEEGCIMVDVRNAPPIKYNVPASLVPVIWGEDIHLDSPSPVLEVARRTLTHMYKDYGKILARPNYDAVVNNRLGITKVPEIFMPEHVVLSSPGRIHLFPALPPNIDVRFERILAVGGFEVSGEREGGIVKWFEVKSTAGEVCRFKNPWYSLKVQVLCQINNFPMDTTSEKDTVSFETQSGRSYRITRSEK
ncbi:MAG: hypothetical protein V2A65_08550 [Candidatus Omnitrophota bacterium]